MPLQSIEYKEKKKKYIYTKAYLHFRLKNDKFEKSNLAHYFVVLLQLTNERCSAYESMTSVIRTVLFHQLH